MSWICKLINSKKNTSHKSKMTASPTATADGKPISAKAQLLNLGFAFVEVPEDLPDGLGGIAVPAGSPRATDEKEAESKSAQAAQRGSTLGPRKLNLLLKLNSLLDINQIEVAMIHVRKFLFILRFDVCICTCHMHF
jgi:hypothetical protein